MTYDIPASGRFFCYILPLLLALCAVSLNACGEPDMNRIAPQFAPQPVGVVGAPQQGAATTIEPPDNHKSALSQYQQSIVLAGSGSAIQQWATMPRSYWKEPVPVTVQARVQRDGFQDSADSGKTFVWAYVNLQIVYGDNNAENVLEVPAGTDVTVLATYVQVYAKLSTRDGYTPRSVGEVIIPQTVTVGVSVSLIEGETAGNTNRSRFLTANSPGDQDLPLKNQGPILLQTLTGYQDSADDLYLMVFDSRPQATAAIDDQKVADGDHPLYQFKCPAGQNFSVDFADGFPIQHGLYAIFSTTADTLTATNPAEYDGTPVVPGSAFALNYTYVLLSPFRNTQAP